MKTAQEMVAEMYEAGLTDQAIADLALKEDGEALDQGHVHRIRNGKRTSVQVATWAAINTAYLKWKADEACKTKRLLRTR